jgi:pimeloyl-ACP methyl ester carboxylesterase/membrane protein DedA with SNARE-associated domain
VTRRRRVLLALLATYAALLGASWGAMERAGGPAPRLDQSVERWASRASGAPHEVALAYSDRGPRAAPVVLLLHGSPGAHTDFVRVTDSLEDRFRCIAPDLPGFGASSRWVPSYSALAHAQYTLELMDRLGIEAAHVVGYSMGSAVGLELYGLAPTRVRSLVMFAALGVVELELFGDPTLNHGLHQLQLAALRALRWGVPHFGALDRFALNVTYARNFTDTDQRRLRPLLEAFEPPLYVLHGAEDFLVPVAAAEEHARIVPHAELDIVTRVDVPDLAADARLGPGHFLPFTSPALVGERIGRFLDRAEAGGAPRRQNALAPRVQAAAAPFDSRTVPPFQGPALLAILVLLALGTLVSEDLACIAAGLLVADERLGFASAAAACFIGIFVGDMLLFLAGRFFGRTALRHRPLRWVVSEDAVARASRWFAARGAAMIFLSRLTPGLRLPTYVAAGILRTSILKFALFFVLAGLVWVPALVGVAAALGREAAAAFGGLGWSKLPWLILLVLLLRELFGTVPMLFTHRGRRMLRGRWIRRTRWEFWPPWITYTPLLLWIVWLGVRHRGLSKVTAANPAIPGGGFVGESKAEILRGLGDAPEVPPWLLLRAELTPDERAARARAFVAEHRLDFPVILKPDTGQRGSGVYAARDEAELDAAVRRHPHDTLVQARVDGPEYGVFYIRHPDEPVGRIFAITVKILPTVTGDGVRTLEELVLDDPRACALHAVYARENPARFDLVVPHGEVVRLVEVGTHARGALFLDGRHLVTPELTAAIDRLSQRFAGFHFGRYDLRVPSEAHLRRGEGLGVIELNGVTSEATNVYDPALGIFEAYRILGAQWAAAYEIGAVHAARGTPTLGLLGILREWVRYRRAQRGHRTSVVA